MRIIIDRFEGNIAFCELEESGVIARFMRHRLPPQADEGDVLVFCGGGWLVDKAAAARLREQVAALEDELFI